MGPSELPFLAGLATDDGVFHPYNGSKMVFNGSHLTSIVV